MNLPNFCYCDCHKMWCSVVPPVCNCMCNKSNPFQETLSLCIHGKPLKFNNCDQCANIIDNYAALNNRIEALHEHKIRQIDENRKISGRIDELQNNVANTINDSLDRIEKLEDFHEKFKDVLKADINSVQQIMDGVYKRLDELEECVNRITEDDMKVGRQPHKCPVCNGTTIIPDFMSGNCILKNVDCQSCDKGIVWP
jgi:hypothetical protein